MSFVNVLWIVWYTITLSTVPSNFISTTLFIWLCLLYVSYIIVILLNFMKVKFSHTIINIPHIYDMQYMLSSGTKASAQYAPPLGLNILIV